MIAESRPRRSRKPIATRCRINGRLLGGRPVGSQELDRETTPGQEIGRDLAVFVGAARNEMALKDPDRRDAADDRQRDQQSVDRPAHPGHWFARSFALLCHLPSVRSFRSVRILVASLRLVKPRSDG